MPIIQATAKSLGFMSSKDDPQISFVTDTGSHIYISITPLMIARLSEEFAHYTAKNLRRASADAP